MKGQRTINSTGVEIDYAFRRKPVVMVDQTSGSYVAAHWLSLFLGSRGDGTSVFPVACLTAYLYRRPFWSQAGGVSFRDLARFPPRRAFERLNRHLSSPVSAPQ
jgi:hypothetical protein